MTCTEFAADDRIYKQLNFSNKEKIFTNINKDIQRVPKTWDFEDDLSLQGVTENIKLVICSFYNKLPLG